MAKGHGNTALSAARRGCAETGIDFTKPLLEHARQRAAAEHLQIDFQEGDLEDIPFRDEAFDIVLSTFGVIFAADQRKAACRPTLHAPDASYAPPKPASLAPKWQISQRLILRPPARMMLALDRRI